MLFYGLISTMDVNCFAFILSHFPMSFGVYKVYQANYILLVMGLI